MEINIKISMMSTAHFTNSNLGLTPATINLTRAVTQVSNHDESEELSDLNSREASIVRRCGADSDTDDMSSGSSSGSEPSKSDPNSSDT